MAHILKDFNAISVRTSIDSLKSSRETIRLKYPIRDTIAVTLPSETYINIEDIIKQQFVYLFKEPVEATLFFRKESFKKLVNYNLMQNKLVSKSNNGKYFPLKYSTQPDSIHINKKSFVVTRKGAIFEKIVPSGSSFFISYESKYTYRQKIKDEFAEYIRNKYPAGSVSIVASPTPENITSIIISEAQPVLYFFNGRRYVKVSSQKKLFSVLNNEKEVLASNLMRSNSLSLNNVNDLYSLISHIYYIKPNETGKLLTENIPAVSDVDINIPQSIKKKPDKFALIIGNEDYSSRQGGLGSESNVSFAVRDAEVFKEYCIHTLGLEEKNVFLITNATSAEMNHKIDLVTQLVQRIGNATDLFFYYAGHGFPDEVTREPYLMPVDVSASYLTAAIKLSEVYKKLTESEADKVTIFLDACFSGGGREAGLIAARAVRFRPKEGVITGNVVVFSATSDDQTALPYKDKQHGMFTYFLLKKIQETKGNIDYGSLEKFLRREISIESLRINHKTQDPKVSVSQQAKDNWETWVLK